MKIDSTLNNKQALYLIWATILNQSQSASATLEKTLELFQRLNLNENFLDSFAKISYEEILDSVSRKPAIHRFPRNMSKNLYLSVQFINQKYEGSPCMVFENLNTFCELKERLIEFRGIGKHKADIAADIFENYIRKDVFVMKDRNNCVSLFFTLDKEISILNSLKE